MKIITIIFGIALTLAHAAPPLLPFQGQLTTSAGVAIDGEARVVQFKIYDAPVSGNAVWAGEVHKLSVNEGLVNTILGTKTAFPERYAGGSKVMFSEPLYVEITVDADDSDTITAADPPLLPRQVLLPANFAHVAQSAETVEGRDLLDDEGNLKAERIAAGSISGLSLANGTVPAVKIAANSIGAGQIATGGVANGELADNSVTTLKIKDGEVKTGDIGGKQVTGPTIADRAIGLEHVEPTSPLLAPHILPYSETLRLWSATTRDVAQASQTFDVSDRVPAEARGAILKVIVIGRASGDFTASCYFSDTEGKFHPTYTHYGQNGVTQYGANSEWGGGVVFAPFHDGKKFTYRNASNRTFQANRPSGDFQLPDPNVNSYGTIIGYY